VKGRTSGGLKRCNTARSRFASCYSQSERVCLNLQERAESLCCSPWTVCLTGSHPRPTLSAAFRGRPLAAWSESRDCEEVGRRPGAGDITVCLTFMAQDISAEPTGGGFCRFADVTGIREHMWNFALFPYITLPSSRTYIFPDSNSCLPLLLRRIHRAVRTDARLHCRRRRHLL
jgi:hypothetical protein